jgi:hypothetical protein
MENVDWKLGVITYWNETGTGKGTHVRLHVKAIIKTLQLHSTSLKM